MSRKSSIKPGRPKVHVQGDFRSFGVAKVTPYAVIRAADLSKHIEPLAAAPQEPVLSVASTWLVLDDEPCPSFEDEPQHPQINRNRPGLDLAQQLRLLRETQKILGEYLGEQLTRERKAGQSASRDAIRRIAKAAAKLTHDIASLDNAHLVAVNAHCGDPESDELSPPIDFLGLIPTLEQLRNAAGRTYDHLPPGNAGRRPNASLDRAVGRFRQLLGELGLELTRHYEAPETGRPWLGGSGAAYLLAVFKEFSPHDDESVLWGALKRVEDKAVEAEADDQN
jgi:hypothetical protein